MEANRLACRSAPEFKTPCQPYENLMRDGKPESTPESDRKWFIQISPDHANEDEQKRQGGEVYRLTEQELRVLLWRSSCMA